VNAEADIAPGPATSVKKARRLRDLMSPTGRARYLAWRGLGFPERIVVGLLTGERLLIRRPPAHDLSIAHEVFVQNVYQPDTIPNLRRVGRIVDVGSNVGYTLAYLGLRYPEAALVAFEPHPVHVELLRRNLTLNNLSSRVQIHAAAAGICKGEARLSNEGAMSTLLSGETLGSIPVPVVDFFDAVGTGDIDLLKIDIEGAEYPILMDERFAGLRARMMVVEWHATPERPDADAGISARLTQLGWRLEHRAEYQQPTRHGMLWGYQ
jgi:FkbM family methyltransferase